MEGEAEEPQRETILAITKKLQVPWPRLPEAGSDGHSSGRHPGWCQPLPYPRLWWQPCFQTPGHGQPYHTACKAIPCPAARLARRRGRALAPAASSAQACWCTALREPAGVYLLTVCSRQRDRGPGSHVEPQPRVLRRPREGPVGEREGGSRDAAASPKVFLAHTSAVASGLDQRPLEIAGSQLTVGKQMVSRS